MTDEDLKHPRKGNIASRHILIQSLYQFTYQSKHYTVNTAFNVVL